MHSLAPWSAPSAPTKARILTSRPPEPGDGSPLEERSVAVEVAVGDAYVAADPELDRKVDDLRHEVAEQGGVPLRWPDRGRYGARFCVTAPDPAAAVEDGVAQFRAAAGRAGLAGAPVVNVEAPTLSELSDRNTGPDVPDLLDITQVGQMMGADQALVTILVRSRGFPAPAAELYAGPVWTRASIVDFLRWSESDAGSSPQS